MAAWVVISCADGMVGTRASRAKVIASGAWAGRRLRPRGSKVSTMKSARSAGAPPDPRAYPHRAYQPSMLAWTRHALANCGRAFGIGAVDLRPHWQQNTDAVERQITQLLAQVVVGQHAGLAEHAERLDGRAVEEHPIRHAPAAARCFEDVAPVDLAREVRWRRPGVGPPLALGDDLAPTRHCVRWPRGGFEFGEERRLADPGAPVPTHTDANSLVWCRVGSKKAGADQAVGADAAWFSGRRRSPDGAAARPSLLRPFMPTGRSEPIRRDVRSALRSGRKDHRGCVRVRERSSRNLHREQRQHEWRGRGIGLTRAAALERVDRHPHP